MIPAQVNENPSLVVFKQRNISSKKIKYKIVDSVPKAHTMMYLLKDI